MRHNAGCLFKAHCELFRRLVRPGDLRAGLNFPISRHHARFLLASGDIQQYARRYRLDDSRLGNNIAQTCTGNDQLQFRFGIRVGPDARHSIPDFVQHQIMAGILR